MLTHISSLITFFRPAPTPSKRGGPRSRKQRLHLQIERLEGRYLPSTVAPTAPVFSTRAVSAGEIDLSWNRVSNASGYVIDEWVGGAWRQVSNVGSGSTSAAFTGLGAASTYYFWLGAYNSAGTTWAAGYQSATTFPAAPSFTASAVSASEIDLSWNRVGGASSYVIDEYVNGAWRQVATAGSGATGTAITGLNAQTTYYFWVGAANASGTTWAAGYQSATTRAAVVIDHPADGGAAYSPASGSLFGANGPSYLDVRQGAVGDCWLLASLAEVAAREPAVITSMFTAAGTTVENGVTVSLYSVRLYDRSGAAHSITVDTELPGGGSVFDHPANGVLWVALAEKAYAQANGAGIVTSGNLRTDSYAALDGGDPSWALQAITGQSSGTYAINPTNIAAAWNAGELIVLGSSSHPASQYIVGGSDGTHAYAVVNYASSGGTFTVYNPWGTDSSGWALGTYHGHQVYGLFTASAAFLAQNFASQSIDVADRAGTAPGDPPHPAAVVAALASDRHAPDAVVAVLATSRDAAAAPDASSARATADAVWADLGDAAAAGNFLTDALSAAGLPR